MIVLAAVVLVPFLVVWLVSPGVHYIGWLPWEEEYESTRFEFRYGHATRVVEDSGNHMQWVYGGMPDSITVRDGKRLVVYDEPKAIIKSWADSMEANDDDFHHKGYMGIWSDGTHFWVDGGGVVQP